MAKSNTATMNISLTDRQAEMLNGEVSAGRYVSASEFVRELVREWEQRQIGKDVAKLECAHDGAYERDTTPDEEAAILRAKHKARAELLAEREPATKRKAARFPLCWMLRWSSPCADGGPSPTFAPLCWPAAD